MKEKYRKLLEELDERYLTLLDWDFCSETSEDFIKRVREVLSEREDS